MREADLEALSREELTEVFKFLHSKCEEKYQVTVQKKIAKYVGIGQTTYSKALNKNEELNAGRYRKYIRKILDRLGARLKIDGSGKWAIETQPGEAASPIPERLHFIYYYVSNEQRGEFKIRKAHLEIDRDQRKARLHFYRKEQVWITYSGIAREVNEQVYLLFRERENKHPQEIKEIPALNYLDCSWTGMFHKKLIAGSFASVGPAAGIAIMERTKTEELQESIQSEAVAPEIVRMMVAKRFSFRNSQQELFKLESNRELLKEVKKLEGTYLAFCMESNLKREGIHCLKFKIYNGFQISFISRFSHEHKGYIIDYNHGNLICFFDYNFRTASFGLMMNLHIDPETREDSLPDGALIGVFAGIDNNDNSPMGGRILLLSTEEPFDSINPRMVRFANSVDIELLNSDHPFLIDFFLGHLDRYTDAPILMRQYILADHDDAVEEGAKKQIARFAGSYFNYRLSSSGDVIYKSPFRIYPNGDVMWWIKDDYNEGVKLIGNAYYHPSGIISLFLNRRGSSYDWHQHHLIYVGKRGLEEINLLEGVSTSLSVDLEPRCGRELYQVAQFEDIYEIRVEKFPLQTMEEIIGKEREKIYRYLAGTSGNVIITGKHVPDFAPNRKQEAHELFKGARILAREGIASEVVLKVLEKAFEYGFAGKEQLVYHLNYGDLKASGIAGRIDPENLHVLPPDQDRS